MKLYAIFGHPVSHSISPAIHNAAFEGLGCRQRCYTRVDLPDGSRLKERFLQLGLCGANITVPHKEAAFAQADRIEGIARKVGAVNTWVYENGQIVGYNTDAPGFYESVRTWPFERPLILGAGGTAKAIALYLAERGRTPHILARNPARASYFKERKIPFFTFDEFRPANYDLVINTTSAGLTDDALPAPKELLETILANAKWAVDAIYGKETPFLRLAKKMGLEVKDGSEMLLYQGVLAFELFCEGRVDKEEVERLMRRAMGL